MAVKKKQPKAANTLLGAVETTEPEVEKEKGVSPFQFIQSISFSKEYMYAEETAKGYVPFIVNKTLSAFPDTLADVCFLNTNYHLDKDIQHDYLFYKVSKRKRWKEYLKKTDEEKVQQKLLEDVASVCKYNLREAKQFWKMLTAEQQRAFVQTYVYPDAINK